MNLSKVFSLFKFFTFMKKDEVVTSLRLMGAKNNDRLALRRGAKGHIYAPNFGWRLDAIHIKWHREITSSTL